MGTSTLPRSQRFAHLTGRRHLLRCGTSAHLTFHETRPISLNVPCLGDCPGLLVRLCVHPVCAGSNHRYPAGDESSEEFKAAGLEKLSPAELAKLNAWIQGYREKAEKVAEKKASERAEREKMSLIVSRVDGIWNGVVSGMVIQLEDGSKWKLANSDEHYGGRADHPAVAVWKAGMFGWKMRVSEIAEFYVLPVK